MAICGLVLATGPGAVPARADQLSDGASHFVDDLGRKAISTIANDKNNQPQMRQEFHKLLLEGFDVPYIGRFVLGRYWNVATPDQRQQYLGLFQDMVVATYAARFTQYSGETMKITGARDAGDHDAIVSSVIDRPNGAPPVHVDWRVRDTNGTYKIIDVAVENVSMSITQRSEFASVIERNGGQVQGLLDAMRNKVAQLKNQG